jgi:hypothetical protein
MAFTQTELDALKKAYASGTTRVTYDGRTVEYGSADDLWKRIQNIEAEIAQVAGAARKSAGLVSFSRGDR